MSDGPTIFKRRQRAAWSSGNRDAVSDVIADAGPDLLDRLRVAEGESLLDIGTGRGGSIAIPALCAVPTSSDRTSRRRRSTPRARGAAAGVTVESFEADAENLPFEDARFDVVTSTFGHIFAPRHAVAAREMVRVQRPGGRLGFTSRPPDSGPGRSMVLMGRYLPAPPPGVESPIAWGIEEHVREMFEPHGLQLEFGTGTAFVEFDDLEASTSTTTPTSVPACSPGRSWATGGPRHPRSAAHSRTSSSRRSAAGTG